MSRSKKDEQKCFQKWRRIRGIARRCITCETLLSLAHWKPCCYFFNAWTRYYAHSELLKTIPLWKCKIISSVYFIKKKKNRKRYFLHIVTETLLGKLETAVETLMFIALLVLRTSPKHSSCFQDNVLYLRNRKGFPCFMSYGMWFWTNHRKRSMLFIS